MDKHVDKFLLYASLSSYMFINKMQKAAHLISVGSLIQAKFNLNAYSSWVLFTIPAVTAALLWAERLQSLR